MRQHCGDWSAANHGGPTDKEPIKKIGDEKRILNPLLKQSHHSGITANWNKLSDSNANSWIERLLGESVTDDENASGRPTVTVGYRQQSRKRSQSVGPIVPIRAANSRDHGEWIAKSQAIDHADLLTPSNRTLGRSAETTPCPDSFSSGPAADFSVQVRHTLRLVTIQSGILRYPLICNIGRSRRPTRRGHRLRSCRSLKALLPHSINANTVVKRRANKRHIITRTPCVCN